MQSTLPIHFAPLQGYTEAIYRQAHARIFGGVESYYTPFVRVEHGEIRKKICARLLWKTTVACSLFRNSLLPMWTKRSR